MLLCVCILPFLVWPVPILSAKLQGYMLLVIGVFVWLTIAATYRSVGQGLTKPVWCALGILALGSLLSMLVAHDTYAVLGAPYVNLATPGIWACIGCGLLLRSRPPKQVLVWLYGTLVGVAAVSVLFTWLIAHSLVRLGGLPEQADVLAIYMGIGLLLGIGMWRHFPRYRVWLGVCQGVLCIVMLLTQTRAVPLILAGMWCVLLLKSDRSWRRKLYLASCCTVLLVVAATTYGAVANRITNLPYAARSLQYRLNLQRYALQAVAHQPMGYGTGAVTQALSCTRLRSPDLQTTCKQDYYFNSSHNIFIDRIVGLGWIGGLGYLLLASTAVWTGMQRYGYSKLFACAGLLIAVYYLTNVTAVYLELLFWVVLFQCLGTQTQSDEN